jgi:hypothetical protein
LKGFTFSRSHCGINVVAPLADWHRVQPGGPKRKLVIYEVYVVQLADLIQLSHLTRIPQVIQFPHLIGIPPPAISELFSIFERSDNEGLSI